MRKKDSDTTSGTLPFQMKDSDATNVGVRLARLLTEYLWEPVEGLTSPPVTLGPKSCHNARSPFTERGSEERL